jgi:phosphoribosylformylglycinamidine cyclo-ligase
VGIVERRRVIDGSQIKAGHIVIALAASGPHTNGYTLIRDLLARQSSLAQQVVGETTFLEAVLEPHRCYYRPLKGLLSLDVISGLAHITGGGIKENLDRILPKDVNARIDLKRYRSNMVFGLIRNAAQASDDEMLRTFNLGVGLALVCSGEYERRVVEHLRVEGQEAYVIGEIVPGIGKVECHGYVPYGA